MVSLSEAILKIYATDKLPSYGSAFREIVIADRQLCSSTSLGARILARCLPLRFERKQRHYQDLTEVGLPSSPSSASPVALGMRISKVSPASSMWDAPYSLALAARVLNEPTRACRNLTRVSSG